jgi:aminopeptidase N
MKKFLKWAAIIAGSLVAIIVLTGLFLYYRYVGFGDYPSGGVLSENQSQYDVLYYGIDLNINSGDETISGSTDVKLKVLTDHLDKVELDLLDNLVVSKVVVRDSESLKFNHDHFKLWVEFNHRLSKNEIIDLRIFYGGKPMVARFPPWRGGFNWSKDKNGDDWIGLSCEGEGAKVWFPCKDSPSDEPDSVAINITIPSPYYCASNGVLRSITATPADCRTFHWITHYPINNYGVNVSIGKYDIVGRNYVTLSGDTMPVLFYVLPQDRAQADSLIDMAVDMLKTYRKYFGEYPFAKEKFALAENDYLGMEHQTLNAYGNHFRYTSINGTRYDELMLHEMGHEWWGNKVTVRDWADFWIHEGICTYGEGLYLREKGGEPAYQDYMRSVKKRIKNGKPIIPKRNATTSESYYGDIYSKGAYLMHSLRYALGDSIFFKTLEEWATDSNYTYQNFVSTDDFVQLVNRNTGSDYTKFISDFLYTNNLPEIHVRQTTGPHYEIRISNIDYELPMEVTTDRGTTRISLGPRPVAVESGTLPGVDEMDWYLKTAVVDK